MTLDDQLAALAQIPGGRPEEDWLLSEPVVSQPDRVGGGANATWVVELGPSGERAFFKPMNGVNASIAFAFGHTRASVVVAEVGAYAFARQLGEPWSEMVAPCVLRAILEVDQLAPGSLAAERFGERDHELHSFFERPGNCADAGFFDALIGNQDRRWSNFKFDKGRGELALIDHGFAFPNRQGVVVDSIFLGWRHRAGLASLSDVEMAGLARLRDSGDMFGAEHFLEAERVERLHDRVETMLERGELLRVSEVGPSA